MSLINDIPLFLEEYKDRKEALAHDEVLFNIHEGELLKYLSERLKKQLSEKSYEQAILRASPINVLKRINDKRSKIYTKPPTRSLGENAQDKDKELLSQILDSMRFDPVMTMANKLFNLHKRVWVQPFLDRGMPRLRVIPSQQFIVISVDEVNPLRPTHVAFIMGTVKKDGQDKVWFHAYNDLEHIAFDEDGVILGAKMEVSQGKNPLGRLPGVYINASRHELNPCQDSDTLEMTLLIPTILTDVNFAHMYTSFPILYGIDVEDSGLKRSPNAFWHLKSDPANQKQPTVGVIEPGLDVTKSIELVKSQLSFWMQSRNIKPGAMGSMQVENASSGISKAIDEMDTSEDRQEQVPIFKEAEEELLTLIIDHAYDVWMRDAAFKLKAMSFSKGVEIQVQFPEQRPMVDSTKQIDDEVKKLEAGLTTQERALRVLNPDMNEDEITELLQSINAEKAKKVADAQAAMGEEENEEDPAAPVATGERQPAEEVAEV